MMRAVGAKPPFRSGGEGIEKSTYEFFFQKGGKSHLFGPAAISQILAAELSLP
jgi:hypothetical protein